MLTSDLMSPKVTGQYIKPRYVKEADTILVTIAKTMVEMFQYHCGKSRGELDSCFQETFGQSSSNFICKGFFRLLEDRSVFEAPTKVDPIVVREKLFLLAATKRQAGNFDRAAILTEVGSELELTSGEIDQSLFSDLKENQLLCEFKYILPENLVKRYNTSLAQALLLKATQLEIKIKEKKYLRYRQLFRAIKFRQLLYVITGNAKEGFSIVLDGPISLFKSSQKYGLQMALFLPALLLCDRWQLKARITWKNKEKIFNLDHKQKLYSHYPDTGMYFPPEMEVFVKRFNSLRSDWEISTDCNFLQLESQQICIPDYVFLHHKSKKKIYLEVFGFWRKAALEKRLEFKNNSEQIIIAVSTKMNIDKNAKLKEHNDIYCYKTVLIAKEILKMLEKRISHGQLDK